MKQDKNSRIRRFGEEFISTLETFFISMFAVSMVLTYVVRIAVVNGESMQNTLMPDDKLVTSAWYGDPEVGDIVIIDADESVTLSDENTLKFSNGLNKKIVKRIIAVEGQVVNIDFERGAVYVDDVMLDESYITGLTHLDEGAFTNKYPIEVPEGYIFVLGDNRAVSKDSRSSEIGFVSIDSIVGKVILRLSPLDEFGLIK